MKIEETKNGNIKLVMSKDKAKALEKFLRLVSIASHLKGDDFNDVLDIWDALMAHTYMYD